MLWNYSFKNYYPDKVIIFFFARNSQTVRKSLPHLKCEYAVFTLKNYVSVHSDVSRSCRGKLATYDYGNHRQREIYYRMMFEARCCIKKMLCARWSSVWPRAYLYRWCSQCVMFICIYPCQRVYETSTQHQWLRADNTINDKVVFLYDCRLQGNVDIHGRALFYRRSDSAP